METKEKVSFIHSITAKIMLMVVVMVALSLMACISIANVRASATVNNVNENFILSLTESAAKTLDKIPAEVDFSTQCAAVMQDMRMEGVSSAYGYLVDSDGTMLYHPTADKIGKSVENEVVKGVVSQLQSGNIPQDAVVTYNFNGTVKYAAYALTSDHKIVVMSADKGDHGTDHQYGKVNADYYGCLSDHLLSGCMAFDKYDHKTNSPVDLYYYQNC